MFRCLECGAKFSETLELIETHGLDTPPFEKRYVCPHCRSSSYKPLIKDNVSRREVLDKLIDIMQALNEFEYAFCDLFSETALDGTKFDIARNDMYELMISVAGDDDFELPGDIDSKISDVRSTKEAEILFNALTNNIEE